MTRRLLAALCLTLVATLARGAGTSTTFMWSPAVATAWDEVAGFNATLACASFVAPVGITNATSIVWDIASVTGSGNCSIGIYDETGATRLATTGAVNCTTLGVHVASGITPFSLVPGVKYLTCECTDGFVVLPVYQQRALIGLDNELSIPIITTGATACTGGAVPTSTGMLTLSTGLGNLILLFGTNSP